MSVDEAAVEEVHKWVASINLSKTIRHFPRDFSDAVLVAEIVAHYLPRYVSLNNFAHVSSTSLKRYNWDTLHKMVLRYLNISLDGGTIHKLAAAEPGYIEPLLLELKRKIEVALHEGSRQHLNQLDFENGQRDHSARLADEINALRLSNANLSASPPTEPSSSATKDELIEHLYGRIRSLEAALNQKEGRINELTKQVEKLLEIICRDKESKAGGFAGTPMSSEGRSGSGITDVADNDLDSPVENLR
ncbi:sporangia induced sperm flagellar protein [Aphelenchoides avenae]|nr:sporangia induced sperm flagellar protein [Aphelenchus avenae]